MSKFVLLKLIDLGRNFKVELKPGGESDVSQLQSTLQDRFSNDVVLRKQIEGTSFAGYVLQLHDPDLGGELRDLDPNEELTNAQVVQVKLALKAMDGDKEKATCNLETVASNKPEDVAMNVEDNATGVADNAETESASKAQNVDVSQAQVVEEISEEALLQEIFDVPSISNPALDDEEDGTGSRSVLAAILNEDRRKTIPTPFQFPILPSHLRTALAGNKPLLTTQRCHLIRIISEEIVRHKLYPDRSEYNTVIAEALEAFPKLKTSYGDIQGAFRVALLKRVLVDRKRALKVMLDDSSGPKQPAPKRTRIRLPKKKLYLGPKQDAVAVQFQQDELQTHEMNVKKMAEVSAQRNPSSETLTVLMIQTYEVRRQEIKEGTDTCNVLRRYPALRLRHQFVAEFERIVKDESMSSLVKKNWEEIAPFIIELAKMEKGKTIEEELRLLQGVRPQSPYVIGKAALRLLPRLLYGHRRSLNAPDFLLQSYEAGSCLDDIVKSNRSKPTPFVVEIGERSLALVVESEVVVMIEDRSAAEIICLLLSAYYVFNMQYAPEVKVAFMFLQEQLMGMRDSDSVKYSRVQYVSDGLKYLKGKGNAASE